MNWATPDSMRYVSIDAVRTALREHWLTGVVCDHESGTDAAACFCCTWRSPAEKSPVAAAHAWIEHVIQHLSGFDPQSGQPFYVPLSPAQSTTLGREP